jgi:acylphosphatase
MATRSVHVVINGRVQGVGFRAWTERQAKVRGLSGWVCNRRGGTVEAVFAGEAEAVEAMLAAARIGPPGAQVDAVVVSEHPDHPTGAFSVLATY